MRKTLYTAAVLLLGTASLALAETAPSKERVIPIPFGDMEHWVTRNIKESAVIGGHDKTLYEIGPDKTINGNVPYTNLGGSPWGTSNVFAKVAGVVKTNCTATPDTHKGGRCAKLATKIESLKVLGLVNINVLAAGSIYLGDMHEPITGTKDGPKSLNWGIPFRNRPRALRYDYRISAPGTPNRIKQTGFSSKSTVPGPDKCVTLMLLQQRSEDAQGNITARRVGTVVVMYDISTPGWVENATYEVLYGDITSNPRYDAATMGLRDIDYATNSKGENVHVRETGWAPATATPTHLVLQFSSSHGGAYVGTPGNTMWVDNVCMVY